MTNTEKVKHIRDITMSPMTKISAALAKSNWHVEEAIKILVNEKQTSTAEMETRVANARIVYSYVHSNRVGAMIVLACQTDFVAKNELFLNLAKDICMHIVSAPNKPYYIDENDPGDWGIGETQRILIEIANKPQPIRDKIFAGKMQKYYAEVCLLHQPFVKDDKITIKQLIQSVSATLGEKIEVKKFVKVTTNESI
jgi:elongation factor Ts